MNKSETQERETTLRKMSKTKILILTGAILGLILVVGLAVGLTIPNRPKSEASAQNLSSEALPDMIMPINDMITPGSDTTMLTRTTIPTTMATARMETKTMASTSSSTVETTSCENWANWSTCSKYCRQARQQRFQLN